MRTLLLYMARLYLINIITLLVVLSMLITGLVAAMLGDRMDDSLSAVDTGTERDILQALERRRGRHTTIVIAHRLSSIMTTDRIMVLDHGRLVQLGDHATLAREIGPYRRLCEIQGELDASISADLTAADTVPPVKGTKEESHG